MDYWNFFAKRAEELRNTTSYLGHPSFFQANRKLMHLRTNIVPKNSPKIGYPFRTTFREYSRKDWRGINFDRAVPTKFQANKPYTFSGTVTLTDQSYDQILIGLMKADGTSELKYAPIINQRFQVTTQFPEPGNWLIGAYLYYPGSGPQYAVTNLSGIIVN